MVTQSRGRLHLSHYGKWIHSSTVLPHQHQRPLSQLSLTSLQLWVLSPWPPDHALDFRVHLSKVRRSRHVDAQRVRTVVDNIQEIRDLTASAISVGSRAQPGPGDYKYQRSYFFFSTFVVPITPPLYIL
jgi:hypothetical protein